jgi:HEPN domain-containing protein
MADSLPVLQQSAALYHAAAVSLYSRASSIFDQTTGKGAPLKVDTLEFTEMMGGLMGSVVLHAFAVELALKALCMKRRINFPRTHDLSRLFALLPQEDQVLASEGYAKRDPASLLTDVLRTNANAFEEWRYQHEYRPTTVASEHLSIAFHQIYGLSK